jgi:hypothetical protein
MNPVYAIALFAGYMMLTRNTPALIRIYTSMLILAQINRIE